MERVKTLSAVPNKPPYSPTGTPGYFTSGNPLTAQPPTVPGPDWFNMTQEEIINVILAAGMELDPETDTQLRDAIAALIATHDASGTAHADIRAALAGISVPVASTTEAGIVERATPEEVAAGLDTERYVCPADLLAALTAGLAGVARVGAVNAYTRQQYPVRVDRANASGNQAVDCDLHQALGITATGNLVMATPTNMTAEKEVRLRIYAASAFTIGWATGWAGTTLVPLPTATVAGKWMHLTFVADDATTLALVGYSVRA